MARSRWTRRRSCRPPSSGAIGPRATALRRTGRRPSGPPRRLSRSAVAQLGEPMVAGRRGAVGSPISWRAIAGLYSRDQRSSTDPQAADDAQLRAWRPSSHMMVANKHPARRRYMSSNAGAAPIEKTAMPSTARTESTGTARWRCSRRSIRRPMIAGAAHLRVFLTESHQPTGQEIHVIHNLSAHKTKRVEAPERTSGGPPAFHADLLIVANQPVIARGVFRQAPAPL